MATVRYIVDDVDAAMAFYRDLLGFVEVMRPAPTFAMLSRGDLRLVLSKPGGGPGGGQALPDGTLPAPGGWNRFAIQVSDLDAMLGALRAGGVRLRSEVVEGVGGRQVVANDPSGNPVELFQPTRDEAVEPPVLRVVGRVSSPLAQLDQAPRQGDEGAPEAWLEIDPAVADALTGVSAGDRLVVLTWLHLADRDRLQVHPRGEDSRPLQGVFATRSPARPNPIGLHAVRVLEVDGSRVRVSGMEAVDGTPVVDLKPVLAGGAADR
jgi:tRNA-Thr(GGU) m(6)t(6)A37 methyltransferase TsaA